MGPHADGMGGDIVNDVILWSDLALWVGIVIAIGIVCGAFIPILCSYRGKYMKVGGRRIKPITNWHVTNMTKEEIKEMEDKIGRWYINGKPVGCRRKIL